MSERQRLLLILEGVALGAVVATGITFVLLRYVGDSRSPSKRQHVRDRDASRKPSKSRVGPRSRSQSPGRRLSRRQSSTHGLLNELDENEVCETLMHDNSNVVHKSRFELKKSTSRQSRPSSPFQLTPVIRMLQTDAPTDDEYALTQTADRSFAPVFSDSAAGTASDPLLPSEHSHGRDVMSSNMMNPVERNPDQLFKLRSTQFMHEFGRSLGSIIEQGRAADEAALQEDYCRVITPEGSLSEESESVCIKILESLELRRKWLFRVAEHRRPERNTNLKEAARPSECDGYDPFNFVPLRPSTKEFGLVDGIYQVYENDKKERALFPLPGCPSEFFNALQLMTKFTNAPSVKTFCYQRLMLLEQKFNLHVMMNADKEAFAQKRAPHRDFYNIRKVDTHVHHSACMHQKHLLRFIKSKLKKEPNEVVIFRDGKYLTLKEVFESLQITSYDLNVDTLDMHTDKNIFHRFDKFNLKYNPCGQSRLREIFIKQDNLLHGRFLAEVTAEVFDDLKASKYQHAEYRISIYGSKQVEWDILASWICKNKLVCDNVMWLIQIPRLYAVYKEGGFIEDFEEMIENIFQPLFEVTQDPTTHPQLHVFLSQVVGFDSVDDESRPDRKISSNLRNPKDWNVDYNPPYTYYAFYLYANLYVLNKFRESRGLNTFAFRPHCGEAGELDHLVCGFLLSENIAHGINLRKAPFLQYMYYLAQIGLCMSPLSNNSLFLDYHRNPFPLFFARGLSVSLSTDDPLQIHLTREPLVEEYSIAAQVWKLSSTDLCEIARNSVLHSGFPDDCKKHWVGDKFWVPGPEGNDIHKTNVPNLRLRFRLDTYRDEFQTLHNGIAQWRARQDRGFEIEM